MTDGLSVLDRIGITAGTDKGALSHDYLRHYSRLLAPFRDRRVNIIEIGVHGGVSLRTWERFFPFAAIVGIDINAVSRRHESARAKVRIGSQADPQFLRSVAAEFPPTIVIDDGSHVPEHQLISFDTLFPLVHPGGCYIIEDLPFYKNRGAEIGGAPFTAIERISGYAARLLGDDRHAREHPQDLCRFIDHIELFSGAAAIIKRPSLPSEEKFIADLEDLIDDDAGPWAWWQFYRYLRARRASPDKLERALRRCEGVPPRWSHRELLAEVLARKGDISGAQAALAQAIECAPEPQKVRLHNKLAASGGVGSAT